MTNQEFKAFKNTVNKAGATDVIWWAGCLWINLTDRQAETIDSILRGKGFLDTVTDCRGRKAHLLPSGITIACKV